jgi:hypothetical protein
MSNTADFLDEVPQKKKLPSGLNVITIINFIFLGLGVLGTAFLPMMCKMKDSLESAPGMTPDKIENINAMCNNMGMIVGINILGIIGQAIGIILMRKLKLNGLWIFIAATIVPLLVQTIVLGTKYFTSDTNTLVMTIVSGLLFPVLYLTQKKHLS